MVDVVEAEPRAAAVAEVRQGARQDRRRVDEQTRIGALDDETGVMIARGEGITDAEDARCELALGHGRNIEP